MDAPTKPHPITATSPFYFTHAVVFLYVLLLHNPVFSISSKSYHSTRNLSVVFTTEYTFLLVVTNSVVKTQAVQSLTLPVLSDPIATKRAYPR